MIINKITKCFLTRSDRPNENWTNNDNYIVIADDSEMAKTIMENYPNIELVIENGELIRVEVVIPEPEPEHEPEPTTEELLNIILGVSE